MELTVQFSVNVSLLGISGNRLIIRLHNDGICSRSAASLKPGRPPAGPLGPEGRCGFTGRL